jgi:ATPase subunit of ABC transporter with duplicated ATPase domains
LEQHLARYSGTVVAVTHDRYFLDNVAQWILEIDRGQGIPFEGNYTGWLEAREKRMAIEKSQSKARQRTLSQELEWIRMSPKARQSKSKARISAYEKLAAEQTADRTEELEIQIPVGQKLGDLVIEGINIHKAFGEKVLMDDLSFRLPAGGIVGVIGPNGAGKTTLFRMLTGQDEPDSGQIRVGETVDLGYIDQSRDSLNGDKTVYQEISGGTDTIVVGGRNVSSRAYVSRFNFKKTDQEKKVGNLSGGERNRVHLAKLLHRGCNVLLLDEPTNDLDVDTLRALEEAIANFAGCVVVTSHDRWFLDRLATHILAFEGDGKLTWCEGNFDTYERGLRERMGEDPDEVKQARYKSIHAG